MSSAYNRAPRLIGWVATQICALVALSIAAPVTAQIVHTSPIELVDSTPATPGITIGKAKLTPAVKAGTSVKPCGKVGALWTYVRLADDCPDAAPPPVPPVEAVTDERALIGDQLFLRNAQIVAGFNPGGGLGTINQQAPSGWPRIAARAGVGLLRARDLAETVAILRVEETFAVGTAGAYDFNGQLVGRVTAPGRWTAAGIWTGIGRTGIAIEQRVRLDGGLVRIAVTLTNTTGRALADVRYKRTVDFDTLASPTVTPRIPARGSVETVLSTGAVTALRSDDPRATASYGGEVIESPYASQFDAPQAIGWKGGKTDAGSHLVFHLGDLGPGQSVSFAFEMGFAG